MPDLNPQKPWIVFSDFDNTITGVDVLDAVIEQFSVDREWMVYEEEWKAGRIGSRECLEAQLRSVRVTREALAEYVRTIPIDPFFGRLVDILRERNIPIRIVSDSFSFIIRTMLRDRGLGGIPVFANELGFEKDRLTPSFPHRSPDCRRCAHCKKKHLLEHADKTTVYVGDGLSDVCPARVADMVFAKGSLARALREDAKPFLEFSDLGRVCLFFEEMALPSPKRKKILETA